MLFEESDVFARAQVEWRHQEFLARIGNVLGNEADGKTEKDRGLDERRPELSDVSLLIFITFHAALNSSLEIARPRIL